MRSDLRRRWRSWLVLVLLTGVVGGVSMASVAGWNRTTSAMGRFVAYHRPANGYVEGFVERDDLADLEGVEAVLGGDYFLLVPLDHTGRPRPEQLGQVSPFSTDDPAAFASVARPIVVAGRLANPSVESEVVVDEEMAELHSLEPGDMLRMQGYGNDQIEDLFAGIGTLLPTGEVFDFAVTGIVRSPEDVVPHQRVPDVVYLGSAAVFLGPAFDAAHRYEDVPSLGALFGDAGPQGAVGYELRVDLSKTTTKALRAAVRSLDPEAFLDFSGGDAQRSAAEAERAIDLQATMLLALGGLVAAGGAVLVAQGLRRQLELDRAAQRSLATLGATRRDAMTLALSKASLFGLASVAMAWAVATALSPLTPVGHARRSEVNPGVAVDVAVLGVGGLVLALLLVALVVGSAWREGSAARRERAGRRWTPGGLGHWASQAGLPAPVVAGVRAAGGGIGGGTVLVTVFVAAVGIVGAMGFVASEQRLASDPEMWGWTFDAVVGDGNDPTVGERATETLAGNPMVEAYATRAEIGAVRAQGASGEEVEIDLSAIVALEGVIEPRLLDGAGPQRRDEVALGAATARRLGVGIGDRVDLDGGDGPVPFTLSGRVVMHLGFDADRIGEGGLLAPEGIERLGGDVEPVFVLVDYADGVDPDEAYSELRADWGNTVLRPTRTEDVAHLHDVRFLPVWFSGLVALVAVGTLAFVLLVSIRRRRHDLALLRTLGFESRQLRSTVLVHALTLVLPGAMLGGLVGVAAGRITWSLTARAMGAPDVPVVSFAALGLVVAGALLVGWSVSAIPGRMAARAHPAVVLRSE